MASNPPSSGVQSFWPPAVVGSAGPQNFGSSMPTQQFRPVFIQQQTQPLYPQQYQPIGGQGVPVAGLHSSQNQQLHFTQPISGQSQAIPMPFGVPPQNIIQPHMPGLGVCLSSSYTFAPSTYGHPQNNNTDSTSNTQMHAPPTGHIGSLSSGVQTTPLATIPVQQQTSTDDITKNSTAVATSKKASSVWHEHISSKDGKRYYYNRRTKLSYWDKPLELMTSFELADTSTGWKEFITPDGQKFYHNKSTDISKWLMPDEMKFARQKVIGPSAQLGAVPLVVTPVETPSTIASSSVLETPAENQLPVVLAINLPLALNGGEVHSPPVATDTSLPTVVSGNPDVLIATTTTTMPSASATTASNGIMPESLSPKQVATILDGSLAQVSEESTNVILVDGKSDTLTLNEKISDEGPSTYATKQEPAKVILVDGKTITSSLNEKISDEGPSTYTTKQEPTKVILVDGKSIISSLNEKISDEGPSTYAIKQEPAKVILVDGKNNTSSLNEKISDEGPSIYATKQEAKDVFIALLDSVNIESDWKWEQAMRLIINDKRYGALRSLGERKQAFNEYLGKKKKQGAEDRQKKKKKALEGFRMMLEESKNLTMSTRWSKAVTLFEGDERFKSVDSRDRENLFVDYMVELEKKEKAKAQEQHKQDILEYRKFLESCEFIKASSQWRKVQSRLEDDDRCLCLDKFERLEIFQEYIHDLEKEEEEQEKLQKDKLRRAERKNREKFRNLMDEHVSAGVLTAKTHWREYFLKVKELPEFMGVSSNTSGFTPKDLFEDVSEELDKQYQEDKIRVKDAMKLEKVKMTSAWTFEDFDVAILQNIHSPPLSNVNSELLYFEMLDRVQEKEEKEARKCQMFVDNFYDLLYSIEEITAYSRWEDCKPYFVDSQEYNCIDEESIKREIFDTYMTQLEEKAKEKERKREEEKIKKEKEREEKEKRKEKERKERSREYGRDKGKERSKKEESASEKHHAVDIKDVKKKEKDKKHRKRHQSEIDDSSGRSEEDPRKLRKHSSERKKTKRAFSPESDSGSKLKRRRRDHRDHYRKNGAYADFEDGELGEDGEI